MQRQIVTPGPLLDGQGHLIETGYATSLLKTYDKTKVAANRLRIKEWDYYCVCTDHFALALTIADNGYMTMDSISLLNFDDNAQVTTSRMSIPAISKRTLPSSSAKGDVRAAGKDYELVFENDDWFIDDFNDYKSNMEEYINRTNDSETITAIGAFTDEINDDGNDSIR